MNTQNIEVNIEVNNIEDMYKYAKLQFEAFNKVENRPSYNDGYQFCIDDPKDQMWFKQFIQMRFCEELAEAEEARGNDQHFMEELTDGFNFLLAATIMVGKDVTWVKEKWEKISLVAFNKPYYIENQSALQDHYLLRLHQNANWLCNLLKNRPWTQSHFPVSKKEFSERLDKLWLSWVEYLKLWEFNEKDIFDYFAKKYCVNMFRIRSGY